MNDGIIDSMRRAQEAVAAALAAPPVLRPDATVAPCREGVQVTIAFGKAVAVHPHPSGVPGMAPLVLRGGDVLRLPEEEVQRLYDARVVLHPVTGNEKPADPPPKPQQSRGVTIAYAGRQPRSLEGVDVVVSLRDEFADRREIREQAAREAGSAEAEMRERERRDPRGDREGRLPVRVSGAWGDLPPGSWPSPPDVGF